VSRVAIRYSKALFATALQINRLDKVLDDLREIETLAKRDERFNQILQNPLIPASRKLKIITELFRGRVDDLTINFLSLVTQKKRLDVLLEMIERFAAQIDDYNGIMNGELISAIPVGPEQTEDIRVKIEALTGKKIRLESRVETRLIGGFIIKIRDTVIDLSVSGQLEKLRNKLVFG